MSRLLPSALTVGVLLAFAAASPSAMAQAKPAAPAAAGSGKTLDGASTATGKVMNINELRECMKRQDELKVRGAQVEREQADLTRERDEIQKGNDAIKVERDEVTKRNDAVRDFNASMKDYSDRVAAWNERSKALKENTRTGPSVDRERRELNAERAALEKIEAANKTNGAGLMDGLDQAVKALNDKAAAQQALATNWNERNAKLDVALRTYEDNRVDWREECGNRRYREDDEKALRSGK